MKAHRRDTQRGEWLSWENDIKMWPEGELMAEVRLEMASSEEETGHKTEEPALS